MRFIFLTLLLLSCIETQSLLSQTWTVHLSGNELFPANNDRKGQHPMLWYSSAQEKVVIGGFGLGVSYLKTRPEKLSYKIASGIHRSRFYDVPSIIRDENGVPVLADIGVNTHYHISLFAAPAWYLFKNERIMAGAGLGVRAIVFSKTDYGEAIVNGKKSSLNLRNKSLSPVVAFLPAECTVNFGRFSVGSRAEFSLTKVSRLKAFKSERYLLWFLEAGYRITDKK